jgi:hypothetical protein
LRCVIRGGWRVRRRQLFGDGGPAASASLQACGVTADHHGNLVIADTYNNRIREIAG